MQQEKYYSIVWVVIFTCWLAVLPLVFHIKIVDVPEQIQDLLITRDGTTLDFFSYWKTIWLISGAVFFFIVSLLLRYNHKLHFKPDRYTILLFLFFCSVLLSFAFSNYKNVSWFGYLDRYEGTMSWISYCMIAYAAHTFFNTKSSVIVLVKGIVVSAFGVSLIGALQYIRVDFFKTEIAKKILLGDYYNQMANFLEFSFPEGQSYSTLYNPNYLGSYVALTFPLCIFLYKYAKIKTWKYLAAITALLSILSLLGSGSQGGQIALLATLFAMFLYYFILNKIELFKVLTFNRKRILIVAITLLLIVVAVVGFKLNDVDHLKPMFSDISVDNGIITITTKNKQKFSILNDGNNIRVILDDGNNINHEEREDLKVFKLTFINDNSFLSYYPPNGDVAIRYIDNNVEEKINFKYYPQLGYFSIGTREIIDNQPPHKIALINNEKSFSARGYIWNRTLPLITRSPIIGYGADTFTVVFPQIDLLTKYNVFNDHSIIVDKPHNMPLQLMINFGILGCILFYTILFLNVRRIDYLNFSIIAYVVSSMVNDSITATTSVVFVLSALVDRQR